MTDKTPPERILFKGIRQGILVTMTEDGEWPQMAAELASKIDSQIAFFQGANVVLQVGKRAVRQHELANLISLLQKRNVNLICVLSVSATTQGATLKQGLVTDLEAVALPNTPTKGITEDAISESTQSLNVSAEMNSEVIGTEGILVRRTVRSGKVVKSDGHVIILGDVNAGAKIVAGGDIVVWGHLRGMAHAGVFGDETAVVCALNLQPTQLRIGSLITVFAPSKRRKPRPERAFIQNGQIKSEDWNG